MRAALTFVATTVLLAWGTTAHGASVTSCAADDFCYCVKDSLQDAIKANVERIRKAISEQKSLGKAVGYLSIPLSTLNGSYMALNAEIADQTKRRIERRFGREDVWVLDPGAKDYSLPDDARGGEYMLMWTRVLQGDDGFGKDLDFVYFAGPSDFSSFFSLGGQGDMLKIDRYYDRRIKTDRDLAKIDKALFRNYYGLKASVSFSYGSHDEWNIVRAINKKRRDQDAKVGLANQVGVLFDGKAIAPALFDVGISSGNAHACTP